MVKCQECDKLVEVGIFASKVQYCEKHRKAKRIVQKNKPKESLENVEKEVKVTINTQKKLSSSQLVKFNERRVQDAVEVLDIENKEQTFPSKEDIYVYCISKGFKLSPKNIPYKQYQNVVIAVIFGHSELIGFTWKGFSKPHQTIIVDKIMGIEKFYKLFDNDAKEDLKPLVDVLWKEKADPKILKPIDMTDNEDNIKEDQQEINKKDHQSRLDQLKAQAKTEEVKERIVK